ncbi:putative damage-inducible protein DinB [Clavibacter michiganensis]|uniref:mycothiol transferase n=1 Tax=Clavibacter michiganensis TaxID=28447 RepID=UPI00195C9356|nr:DinB family protein [Clavibacter michiganensis]MBM7411005.1 putative damage-inducible protein DinB [Clavibacter michiganensis]
MTPATDLLVDAYGRIAEIVRDAVDGLGADDLAFRPDAEANSVGWLVWHLARVQDAQVADVAGRDQTWTSGGWAGRFALPFDDSATGYGQSPDDVASLEGITSELLLGYLDAVQSATLSYLAGLDDTELDRVIDEDWTPPVTLGARLVSVLADDLQHAGQASYLAGLIARRR